MRLVNKKVIEEFKRIAPSARNQLGAFQTEVENAKWSNPHELKARYPSASILKSGNVVFNIQGNKYRIWAKINYETGIVLVKNIGTHEDYGKWEIR